MDEKKITKDEFDDAVVKAAVNISDNKTLSAKSNMLLSMIGMTFALEMSKTLFSEEKED